MSDLERSERLQKVYSARDNRELASSYDKWGQNYEDDMLSLRYAIPAVAAGLVWRHVPPQGTVLDAGASTGVFGNILGVLGYGDLVGMDISDDRNDDLPFGMAGGLRGWLAVMSPGTNTAMNFEEHLVPLEEGENVRGCGLEPRDAVHACSCAVSSGNGLDLPRPCLWALP